MYYFAYGSNLSQAQMKNRCPDARPVSSAVLPNYKLIFAGWSRQWHGSVAGLQSMRGERVRGALYEVSETCLTRLDKEEGSKYQRQKVTVFNADDEAFEAVTYQQTGRMEESKPSDQYLAAVQQGYRDWRLF